MNDDIVQRIDKLILGWEREYGITNKTMVDAMETIINLRSGPGGIMEMKQTIADLEKYRDLVEYISSDYVELSYDKAQWQRDDWRKRCNKLIIEDHTK